MKICFQCGNRFQAIPWRCTDCGHEPPVFERFPALAPEFAYQGGGFRSEYFQALAALESGNFWFKARNRIIIDSLKRHFTSLGSFLEIGCGTGFVLSGIAADFPSASFTGTEIFCTGLSYASHRVPHAEFLQMDARRIPFDAEFDVLGAFDVLEHISEDALVISQMHQAIKPGGGLLMTVPQHPWLWSSQDELACHVRRYSAKELHRKISYAGFDVIEMRSFVSLLLPVLWLSRRISRTCSNPLSELNLNRWCNGALESIMMLEYALCRLGISFPGGGSLLLVARKI